MKIQTIYKKYQIMPNLQLHMFRAAAVGKVIIDHWKDKTQLNPEAIIITLLLHDMGNIIKFELDRFPEILGPEQQRLDYWKNVQNSYVKRYGTDEHIATFLIAEELGIQSIIQTVLKNMGSSNLAKVVGIPDYNSKISLYSDLRVAPFGIVSINERFDDLYERYRGRNHPIADKERLESNRHYCLLVEKQLQAHLDFDIQEITDDTIAESIVQLKDYVIKTNK